MWPAYRHQQEDFPHQHQQEVTFGHFEYRKIAHYQQSVSVIYLSFKIHVQTQDITDNMKP